MGYHEGLCALCVWDRDGVMRVNVCYTACKCDLGVWFNGGWVAPMLWLVRHVLVASKSILLPCLGYRFCIVSKMHSPGTSANAMVRLNVHIVCTWVL